MKKTTLIIFFSLFMTCLHSQSIKDIEGFGKLRLGMTLSEVKEIVDTLLLKDLAYYGAYETMDGKLSHYLLDRYEIAPNYYLENISLKFYEETLYQIIVHKYNRLTEVNLTFKYGSPEVRIIESEDNDAYNLIVKEWSIPNFEKDISCMVTFRQNEQLETTHYTLSLTISMVSDMIESLETMIRRNKYK